MWMKQWSFALGSFEKLIIYIFISDLQKWVIIVLFVLLQFCIFNATCRKNTFRLYTCLGNKCLNWLCLNKGQCLCNLVAIWCLKVSFEIKSIVWIRDKTVNIQEKKSQQSSSSLAGLKHCNTRTEKSTSLPPFIISSQLYIRKALKPLRVFSAWESKTTLWTV